MRNIIRKSARKLSKSFANLDKKLEPTPGDELRELINDSSIPTSAKLEALAMLQARIKELQAEKELEQC